MVAGAMAPERVKGVSTIGWPWRAISSQALDHRAVEAAAAN